MVVVEVEVVTMEEEGVNADGADGNNGDEPGNIGVESDCPKGL